MKHLSDARPLALPTNIRLGWRGLPGDKHSSLLWKSVKITAVKSFIVQARALVKQKILVELSFIAEGTA